MTTMYQMEVIGILSEILKVIDCIDKVYKTATNSSGLPEAFHTIALRLPLVQKTLSTALGRLEAETPSEELHHAIKNLALGCQEKVERLEAIFKKVIPAFNASRMERYFHAVMTLGKGDRVEILMRGILDDVQVLVGDRMMGLASVSDLDSLTDAIKGMEAFPTSQGDAPSMRFYHYGTGPQNINTGDGSQNNNNGSGQQFLGGTFSGTFNFRG